MKKLKKAVIILLAVCALGASAILILNLYVIPRQLTSLIVDGIRQYTGKRASVASVQFNLFKGLVAHDITIFDDTLKHLKLKEASCSFVLPALFKRQLLISSVTLRAPEVNIIRQKDGRASIMDFIPAGAGRQDVPPGKTPPSGPRLQNPPRPALFSVAVLNIRLIDGTIHFQDENARPLFAVDISRINARAHLSGAGSVVFELKAEVAAEQRANLSAEGEFVPAAGALKAKVSLRNAAPANFCTYFAAYGVSCSAGGMDVNADIAYKDGFLNADVRASLKNILASYTSFVFRLTSDIETHLEMPPVGSGMLFSGAASIANASVEHLPHIGEVSGIQGNVSFDTKNVTARGIKAVIWDIPLEARLNLTDFRAPVLDFAVISTVNLTAAQEIAAGKFKVRIPGRISGTSGVFAGGIVSLPLNGTANVTAVIDLAAVRFESDRCGVFEDITGRLRVTPVEAMWENLTAVWQGKRYTARGNVYDFTAPHIQGKAASDNASLDYDIIVKQPLITIARCEGTYANSAFNITGGVNITDPAQPAVTAAGKAAIELADIAMVVNQTRQSALKEIKPQGLVNINFTAQGKGADVRSWGVQAQAAADNISLYGLKAHNVAASLEQSGGTAAVPSLAMDLYGGKMDARGALNLTQQSLPFWAALNISGIKLEKLKEDTHAAKTDLAGDLAASARAEGSAVTPQLLSGSGDISISDGKLWELDLFKGLGSLLFVRDFANITFNRGHCTFTVKDTFVSSDDITLNSPITNLTGSLKIGFDNSLDGDFNIEVLDEMAPLSGTIKDITTAIAGQAGRFGTIKITGTLQEPKFKFRAADAVKDIIKGIRDMFLGKSPDAA